MEHALDTTLSSVALVFDASRGNGPNVPSGWSVAGNWSKCVDGTSDSLSTLHSRDLDCHAPHLNGLYAGLSEPSPMVPSVALAGASSGQ